MFGFEDIQPTDGKTQEKIDMGKLLDRQENGFLIEKMVETGMSYLEATTAWLEENSIPETYYNKFIPPAIIEKIMSEAIDENLLRPSVSRGEKTNTIEFLL